MVEGRLNYQFLTGTREGGDAENISLEGKKRFI